MDAIPSVYSIVKQLNMDYIDVCNTHTYHDI